MLALGFFGQAMFSARFLVQWLASERARKSIVPTAFWWLSIAGGATLFTYAVLRQDPVFILGQGAGLLIYSRNLYLLRRERRQVASAAEAGRSVGYRPES
ncbi:MAG: hypothetical protein D6826_00295 [Alphaproteobacteria bacterium]|nr:MAG: hypothetical protein D6826_00295 [Alphaproteobacteria bacterium]